MLAIEIGIFKRPSKHLAQYANPPHPKPNFIACIAFPDADYVLRNFRADTLDGILSQMGSLLRADAEIIARWFADHDTWFSLREVSDEQLDHLLRTGLTQSN
jgi:hypothetical protein